METDGVMVRYADGWHEVKAGVVGGWNVKNVKKERLQAQSYVASREESAAFTDRFATEAARRGALAVVGWHGPHQGLAELRRVAC